MANLIAYVLSKNTYPTASEAGYVATSQGTQVVYATTSTLTTSNELYKIEKLAESGMNTRFGVNMALLTVSNAIQFDNLLKSFNSE